MNIADKEGNIIKSYDLWKKDKKDEPLTKTNYSYELLKELRDKRGNADIANVRELLALGADPNYSLVGHTDEDKYIEDINKADIDELQYVPKVKMQKWYTLKIAININRLDILEELFKHGANPNLEFEHGTTAFYYLLGGSQKYNDVDKLQKIVDLFIKNGANVNVTNKEGKTLIHKCVEWSASPSYTKNKSYLSLVPSLIKSGINPYAKDSYGKMAYQYMFQNYHDNYGEYHKTHEEYPEAESVYSMLKPTQAEDQQKKKGFFRKK